MKHQRRTETAPSCTLPSLPRVVARGKLPAAIHNAKWTATTPAGFRSDGNRHCEPQAWQSTPNAMPSPIPHSPPLTHAIPTYGLPRYARNDENRQIPHSPSLPQNPSGCSLYPIPQTLYPKSGISLIAVLMFMLAATIGSTVLFRWLGSENQSSGARLKYTEAQAASQSGIEAVHSYLSTRSADVGALLSAWEKQTAKTPIDLTAEGEGKNNILGKMQSSRKQEYKVYFLGFDKPTTTSSPLKLKFLSIGTARDGSRFTQSAIFDVAGLYNVKVPKADATNMPNDFDYAYFGGSTSFAGSKQISNAAINGNWEGNPPEVKGDFIVTGNFRNSGNAVNVDGTACIGGNFDPNNNNGFTNRLYVGGNAILKAKYGDVYVEGNVSNPNNGVIVYGDLNVNGTFNYNQSYSLDVGGMLVMGTNGKINVTSSANSNLTSCGGAYIPSSTGITGVEDKKLSFAPATCPITVWQTDDYSAPTTKTLSVNTDLDGSYTTSATNNFLQGTVPEGANEVKEYCMGKWTVGEGCNDSKYIIEDPLSTSLDKINDFYGKNSPTCAKNIQAGDNTDQAETNLNACYTNATTTQLYNGYLVVKYDSYSQNHNSNTPLDGNFIFIFDFALGAFRIPPTLSTSKVIMFLKEGSGNLQPSSICNNPYNYFIYSQKKIDQLLGWNQGCQIKGSVFFPQSSCAGIGGLNGGDNMILDSNAVLIKDLMASGILCKRASGGSGDCTEQELTDTKNGEGTGTPTITYESENYYIPVSSRLKADIASVNISKEEAPATTATLEPSILVMPRVVRLTKDAFSPYSSDQDPLRRFYTFMHLNGATAVAQTAEPHPTCTPIKGGTASITPTGTPLLLPEDTFRCTFSDEAYSDFYVEIEGERGAANVSFSPAEATITENATGDAACETVRVVSSAGDLGFSVNINIERLGTDQSSWEITPSLYDNENCQIINTSFNPTAGTSLELSCDNSFEGGDIAAFRVCSTKPLDDYAAIFTFVSTDGINIGSPSKSTVSRETPTLSITRTGYPPETEGSDGLDFVPCPYKDANWLTLTCGIGTTSGNVTDGWECDFRTDQNATVTLSPPNGCELPPEDLLPTNGYIQEVSQAAESGSAIAEFALDLAWKFYSVSVKDGSVTLSTATAGVPSSFQSQTCSSTDQSTCKVYHGATYTVTLGDGTGTGKKQMSCDPALACSGNYLDNGKDPIVTGTITPTGDGTITLAGIAPPTFNCNGTDEPNVKKIKGESFTINNDLFRISNIAGYECGSPTITYFVDGASASSAVSFEEKGTHTITATVECDGLASAQLDCGNLVIADETFPTITCAALGGKTAWKVGEYPKFTITTTDGNLQNCGTPSAPTDYTLSGTESPYTLTANSPLADGDVAGGKAAFDVSCGSYASATYECPALTVEEVGCEYEKSFCNNMEYSNVKTSNNTSGSDDCRFVSVISKYNNGDDNVKINGTSFKTNCGQSGWGDGDTPCETKLANAGITKKDGGYYIYKHDANNGNNSVTPGSSVPQCVKPRAECTWDDNLAIKFIDDPKVNDPVVICTDGSTPDATISGFPPIGSDSKYTTRSNGTPYSVTANVSKCGTKTPENANKDIPCGTLTVKEKPSGFTCTGPAAASKSTGEAAPQPTYSVSTDPDNVCAGESPVWTASHDGTDKPLPATFAAEHIGYWSNFKGQIACLSDSRNFTINSTPYECGNQGTVTVSAPAFCPSPSSKGEIPFVGSTIYDNIDGNTIYNKVSAFDPNANDCFKYDCPGKLWIGTWNGDVNITTQGGCASDGNKTASNYGWREICTSTGEIIFKVTNDAGNMQLACTNPSSGSEPEFCPSSTLKGEDPFNDSEKLNGAERENNSDIANANNGQGVMYNHVTAFDPNTNDCFKYKCPGKLWIGTWNGDVNITTQGCTSDGNKTASNYGWREICTSTGEIIFKVTNDAGNMQLTCTNPSSGGGGENPPDGGGGSSEICGGSGTDVVANNGDYKSTINGVCIASLPSGATKIQCQCLWNETCSVSSSDGTINWNGAANTQQVFNKADLIGKTLTLSGGFNGCYDN